MVRREGIEPPSDPCKGPALPLDERRMGYPKGIDPLPWAPQTQVLPLHQGHHWSHWAESNSRLPFRRGPFCPLNYSELVPPPGIKPGSQPSQGCVTFISPR